jgi:hypothetical protein
MSNAIRGDIAYNLCPWLLTLDIFLFGFFIKWSWERGICMSGISIFVSYSHKDEMWVKDKIHIAGVPQTTLIPYLSESLRKSNVGIWYDHALKQMPGEEYKERIKSEIDRAQFVILLISQNFLNSDFIREFELPLIKERMELGKLSIIPIMVGPADLDTEGELNWLNERQMLPSKPDTLINYIADIASWQTVIAQILRAIRGRIVSPPIPPIPPPPSPKPDKSMIAEKPKERRIVIPVRPKSKLLVISLRVALAVILGGAVAYWSFTSKDKHAPIPAPESKTVALGLQQPNALTKTDNDLLPVHTVNGIIPSKSPNNQTSPQLFFRKDSICTLTDQELKEIKIYIDMLGRQDRVGPAAFGLSSIGVCCIKPLIEVLNDKAKLAGACTILSRFGEPAVMPLIEALKDKDRMIGACAALGWIGRPAIIPLIEALKHKDEKLGAIYALQDLQRMGQPVIKPLIEELKYDDKIGAMKCLELIGRPAIKPLVQALYNDSTRTGAMVLLGRMGEPALNDLFQALQSENKQVVLAAQISISDIKKTQSNR